MTNGWLDHFPALRRLPSPLVEVLVNGSRGMTLAQGQRVFGPGTAPADYLLLPSGTIRVQHFSKGGREIGLNRISAGEASRNAIASVMKGRYQMLKRLRAP